MLLRKFFNLLGNIWSWRSFSWVLVTKQCFYGCQYDTHRYVLHVGWLNLFKLPDIVENAKISLADWGGKKELLLALFSRIMVIFKLNVHFPIYLPMKVCNLLPCHVGSHSLPFVLCQKNSQKISYWVGQRVHLAQYPVSNSGKKDVTTESIQAWRLCAACSHQT